MDSSLSMKSGTSTSMTMPGFSCAHCFDRLAEMFRAAVGQVVARHGGDDDVLQAHPAGGLGHARGFIGFEGERFGGGRRRKSRRRGCSGRPRS